MSTTIDQRVVEMRFDNKHFESNVSTTMSTLEKLKSKLNFSGASKGLENINTATKNVNMNGLGSAVQTVSAKFSALQVAGVTALANITNSAVNAGKRIVSSLTVEPVKDGFSEYEMTLNAVQTTMAGTGKTAAEVQEELKKLDEYADKTVYSTADMLNNLPKFTNAGVDLEKATKAMIGIANATALAGGDAGKASIAFYNLGQAIGTGYLTRMDYNSINNAGIATMEWKNQMVEAAIAQGTLTKVGEDAYQAGNKTLTLQQLFIDGLQEQWATTDVMMEVFGDYGDETTEIGKKAYGAAQDLKTFTMMMDSLKATAGTGWKDTWQLVFGDLDQAKALWTGLGNFIGNIITSISDFRNGILEVAMSSPFGKLADKLSAVTGTVETVTGAVEKYDEIVNRIIDGDFGNGHSRWDALSEDGYDWAKAQNLVNEKLGSSVRHTEQLSDAQKDQTKTQATTLEQLIKMNDAQLESLGFTKSEIDAFRDLEEQSKKTGIPIEKLAKDLDQLSGRNLLIGSFKNIAKAIGEVITTIKSSWQDIFPPKTVEERGAQLYDMISALHKFTASLGGLVDANGKLTETGDKLARTFKGVFAVLDVITTVAGGGLRIAFKVLNEVLKHFDLDILDVTAAIGDALVGFRDFIDSVFDISAAVESIIPYVERFVSYFSNAASAFKDWINALKTSENIGEDIIAGIVAGLVSGAGVVWDAALALGKSILESICSFLGIHSPSTEMIEVGENTVEGLAIGLQNGVGGIWTTIKGIGAKIRNWFKNLDFGTIFAVGVGASMIALTAKIGNALATLASPMEGLGDMFEDVGIGVKKFLTGVGSAFKASAWEKRGKAMLSFAGAIAILAASVYVLAQLDTAKLWSAVGAITVIAAVIGALSVVIGKMGATEGLDGLFSSVKLGALGAALLGLSLTLLAIAGVVKILGGMDPDQAKQGFLGLAGLIGAIVIVLAAYGTLVKGKSAQNIGKLGGMMLKLSIALLLLAAVTKLVGGLSENDMVKGAAAMGAFVVFVGLLAAVSRLAGKKVDKLGGMLIKLSIAMGLLVGVVKLAGYLSEDEMKKGAVVMGAFIVFVGLLAAVTRLAGGKSFDKIGSTILSIAGAMAIMLYVGKVAAGLDAEQMKKGAAAIVVLGVIAAGLVAATRLAGGNDLKRVGTTLIMMSISIGILAGVVALLGLLNESHLAKGLIAVGVLGAVMTAMIWATRGAKSCVGNLIVMTVAIGLMAAAVAALSMIDGSKLAGATIAMATLMGMFALIAKSSSDIKTSMGSLIVLTVVVGLLAAILYVLSGLPADSIITVAVSLSILLTTMSGNLKILSGIKSIAAGALLSLGIMVLVVGLLGGILYLLKDLPVESTMSTALSLSALLLSMSAALAILTLVGMAAPAAFAGMGALATLIVGLGALIVGIGALVKKVPQLEAFLDTGIPILEKIGNALGSFFGNIVGGFLDGITDGLPDMATNLSNFMTNLQPFIDGVSEIDGSMSSNIKTLVDAIVNLTKAELISGISSFITGGDSLSQFAEQLVPFGSAMKNYAAEVAGIDSGAISNSVTAANSLVKVAQSIPGDGVFGTDGIDDFGRNVVTFARSMKSYGEEVAGINTGAVTASVNAARGLVSVANLIPDDGTFGTDGIDDFGKNVKSFGKSLSAYSNEVSEVNVGAVASSVSAVNLVRSAISSLSGLDTSGVESFKEAVNSLSGVSLDGIVDTFSGSASKLSGVGSNMINGLVDGFRSGQSQLITSARTLLNSALSTFNSASNKFKVAGSNAITKFASGMSSRKAAAASSASSVASASDSAMDAYYSTFYATGEYLVTGFGSGIINKKAWAAAKAAEVAQAAADSMKATLDENSPSKVGYEIGDYFGIGFVNGIYENFTNSGRAGASIAESAKNGLSDAMRRLNDMFSSDIDSQPTIRPVMDLSDVETGVSAIGSMLGLGSSGRVLANVGGISASMNRRGQNGANEEIVTAINRLRKDLGNVGNTTYSINGVTYDDGSNISNAVREIVRAARVERRI